MSTVAARALPRITVAGIDSPWARQADLARRVWLGVDAVAGLALFALVAATLYPVYRTPWLFVCVLAFALAGMAVAIVATLLRWRSGTTALATLATWFPLGTPLVMPSAAVAGVFPTLRSLKGLATGPVTAWRDMLTLEPPIGETATLLAVPGLLGLLGGLLTMLISVRTKRPMWAFLPAAVAYGIASAMSSRVPFHPVVLGVAFFLVMLLWTTHRRSRLSAALTSRVAGHKPVQVALGILLVAAAGVATWASLPWLAGREARANLRDAAVPPIQMEQYPSPLQGFRSNTSEWKDSTLFEVRGLEEDEILRLATMDTYDGVSFRVSTLDDQAVEATTYSRVGQWIDDDTAGARGEANVVVRHYSGVWVPTIGRTTRIAFDGGRSVALAENFFYNKSSGAGVAPVGLESGDSYDLDVIKVARPADSIIEAAAAGKVQLPRVDGIADSVRSRAHGWADDKLTPGAQVLALENALRTGYLSHGEPDEVKSLPGHTAARLTSLLARPERMVGDGEQYASAMALMCRELGIPARVVYGYKGNGSPAVTGSDVGAWTEVNLEGLGWVLFDPTPDRPATDVDPPEPPKPQPHVENPPPPPEQPVLPPPDEDLPIDPADAPEPQQRIDWARIGALVAIGGLPLLALIVPVTLIVGLKLRRRSRRRHDPVVANRIAGAWSELVDRARDLGRSPSVSATRSEQAEQLAAEFPKLTSVVDPVAISREADRLVFAPEEPSEGTAKEFWRTSESMSDGMRRSVGLPRWIASMLSTKSFRRRR